MCFYSCPAGNPGGTAEHSGGSAVGELQAETSRLTADLILLREGVDRRPALQQSVAMQICQLAPRRRVHFSYGPYAKKKTRAHVTLSFCQRWF